jgi:hypothetical protein
MQFTSITIGFNKKIWTALSVGTLDDVLAPTPYSDSSL